MALFIYSAAALVLMAINLCAVTRYEKWKNRQQMHIIKNLMLYTRVMAVVFFFTLISVFYIGETVRYETPFRYAQSGDSVTVIFELNNRRYMAGSRRKVLVDNIEQAVLSLEIRRDLFGKDHVRYVTIDIQKADIPFQEELEYKQK